MGNSASLITLSKSEKVGVRPSVEPSTIENYEAHEFGRKGTVMNDMDREIVPDVNNDPISCIEKWNNKKNSETFLS